MFRFTKKSFQDFAICFQSENVCRHQGQDKFFNFLSLLSFYCELETPILQFLKEIIHTNNSRIKIIFYSFLSGYSECLTSDQLGAGVLIDLGHVDDGPSLLGIAQRAQALLHVTTCWTQSGDHGRFGVTPQTFLQQPAKVKEKI